MGSVTAVTLLTLGAYLVAMLLLGRNLPRDRFGYVTLWVYALNLLGAASLLGFPNAVLRHVARERMVRSRWSRLFAPLSLTSAVVCLAGALLFRRIYGAPWPDVFLLFAAGLLVGSSLLPVTLLQIFRRFALAQGLYTLWRPVLLVSVAAMLLWGRVRVTTVFLVVAAGGALQLGLALRALRGAPRGEEPISLRSLAPDAAVFSGLYLAAMLILRLDSFFLPKLMDLDALGMYSALSFVTLTGYGVVSLAVGQVLNPKLASREPVPMRSLAVLIVLGGVAAGLLLAAASNRLLPFVFGSRYAGDHRAVVAALAAAGVLQVLYALPSSRIGILASRRALRAFLVISLSSLAVDAVLLSVLVPRHGLVGAAGATACTWAWRTGGAWVVARLTT